MPENDKYSKYPGCFIVVTLYVHNVGGVDRLSVRQTQVVYMKDMNTPVCSTYEGDADITLIDDMDRPYGFVFRFEAGDTDQCGIANPGVNYDWPSRPLKIWMGPNETDWGAPLPKSFECLKIEGGLCTIIDTNKDSNTYRYCIRLQSRSNDHVFVELDPAIVNKGVGNI